MVTSVSSDKTVYYLANVDWNADLAVGSTLSMNFLGESAAPDDMYITMDNQAAPPSGGSSNNQDEAPSGDAGTTTVAATTTTQAFPSVEPGKDKTLIDMHFHEQAYFPV